MPKRRTYKKPRRQQSDLTPEQQRNALIFRLRGFYANAKTLPFTPGEINNILKQIDQALIRLDAKTQTQYLMEKKETK